VNRVGCSLTRRSAAGFALVGVVYAVAAAGCTAPMFVPVALRGLV